MLRINQCIKHDESMGHACSAKEKHPLLFQRDVEEWTREREGKMRPRVFVELF